MRRPSHLLTLLLLGGLSGSHQPYHAYPSYKKRRDVEDDKAIEDTDSTDEKTGGRMRRFPHPTPLPRSKAATKDTTDEEKTGGRRRRSKAATKDEGENTTVASGGRRRRDTTTVASRGRRDTTTVASGGRRRRRTADTEWIECKNVDDSPCE